MPRLSAGDESLKKLLKAALVEVLEARKDLLQEAIAEALEDVALARAIEQGEPTKSVSRISLEESSNRRAL